MSFRFEKTTFKLGESSDFLFQIGNVCPSVYYKSLFLSYGKPISKSNSRGDRKIRAVD
ncbi:hypothetical protein LEP1GSC047_1786 [Leptospira inadai serovar Lyme str. 10]|uniref:Uncharacterized protein n=1 Tax=Leptospira inadai serovar Lyme str. 10 TaxID=1049790 RepID=V6H976_9LEPT|nr:hypothetical protein LEP1GSC047_1786 [Leptospira inadai serovar Lyme str. 10]